MELLDNYKTIVTYHKVKNIEILESHFSYFKGKGVLVTVDDGDISFYKHMFPLLKKYNQKAILFIVTGLIDTDIPFWWDELIYYLGEKEGEKMKWEVKKWENKKRLQYLDSLRKNSNKPFMKYQQLTVDQLHEMEDAGVIIANHSHTHPMFDQCDEKELRFELQHSKAFFQKNNLQGYEWLAYPNGNFNQEAEAIMIDEGISKAFLFDHKICKQSNPLRISRLSLNDEVQPNKLRFIMSGWHSKVLPIRKKIYNLLHS